jgi:transglutaminase-like putative cysteine protease
VQFTNDVIVSNAVALAKPIPSPRHIKRLRVTLSGPLTERHALDSPRQTAKLTEDGGVFELAHAKAPSGAVRPVEHKTVAQWLEPSQFVQSGAPEIKEQAAAIIGNEKDAYTAAKMIAAWVSENVTTTYSASLSNALDVLASKNGDCTEHSVLFVALARAAGIPAREVAGLVYTANPAPGFYFHQWAEVWAGEWVEMDPTFDQPLADATHIRLSEGDLLRQMHLLPIIGRLEAEAEVVEAD